MELLQLKYFCSAAESENFSKTAKEYLVPTSNISQSIKRLETELGAELFTHTANRVRLNEDGRRFYESVSEALRLLDEGRGSLEDKNGEPRGDIRLVCLNNRRLVTSAIEKFNAKYKGVSFIIRHTPDAVRDFDLFISDSAPFEYSKKILVVDEDISVAMRSDNRLAGKDKLSPSDLEGERFITMPINSSLYRITALACEGAGFSPNIAIQTDDPFYVRKYVEMGLGIAFVPTNSWRGMFGEDIVLRRADGIRRRTYAFLPRSKGTKRSVELFLEVLKEVAENEQ